MQEIEQKPNNIKSKKRLKLKFRKSFFTFPHLLLTLVFTIVPLVFLLITAFTRVHIADDGSTISSFSGRNFAEFFTDPTILVVLGNSLLVALLTTVGCLVIAYPLALALANSKINKTVLLVLMFLLPMYMNSLLRATALRVLFGLFGLTGSGAALALFRIVLAHIYIFFPFMLLPLYTSLSNMDKSYTEAARDLGAGSTKTFFKVVLPLSVPGILSGIFMVFMPVLSSFVIRDIIMSGTPGTYFPLFGNAIYSGLQRFGGDGISAAFSIILLVVVFVVMIVAAKINSVREKKKGAGDE